MHLREHGAHVYGFGDAKTPAPFQSACTRFLVLNRLSSPSGQAEPGLPDAGPADAVPPPAEEAAPPTTTRRRATAKATSKATDHATAKATASAKKTTSKAATKAAAAAEAPQGSTPARATRAQLRGDRKLVALLRRAVEGAADDSGWALVGTVGNHISNQSSFDPRNYGYAKLSKLLETTDLFDMRDSGGPAMAVRDRRGAAVTSTNGTGAGNA
jgi:hypothetical protein